MWKWARRLLLGLVGLVVTALVVIYAWSEVLLGERHEAVERTIVLSSRPDVIARGERLAQVYGCFHGCHGADMEGSVFFEGALIGKIIAPSLQAAMQRYSVSELEAIIRQGLRPDGTRVVAMPSASFSGMTDQDLSAILSFIRAHEGGDTGLGYSRYGPLARLFMIQQQDRVFAPSYYPEPLRAADLADSAAHGEYLAINACSECHGLDLRGQDGFAPDLAVVKAYKQDDFRRLMTEAVGLGGRELGLMSAVARARFSHFTPEEIEQLYLFLTSR